MSTDLAQQTNPQHQPDPSAWLAVTETFKGFTLTLAGEASTFRAVSAGDWVLVANSASEVLAVGRIYRLRSTIAQTTLYFDKLQQPAEPATLAAANLSLPNAGCISRLQWTAFAEGLTALVGASLADIPLIEDHAYVRELLQCAVVDDLLGPAGGPYEWVVDMGVRDRYLVGKLAPQEIVESDTDAEADVEDEPEDLEVKETAKGVDGGKVVRGGEADSNEEVDVSKNQALVPSSMGMTLCVDGEVPAIEIAASWGRYERIQDHDITKPRKNKETGEQGEDKVRVWGRVPCGGTQMLTLEEGPIAPIVLDPENPSVVLKGNVRAKNENGDRLVSLFLVNTQTEPETNRDSAWLFQPEIVARPVADTSHRTIFCRRPFVDQQTDAERAALEMVYRKQVEFAVGHGVAVHGESSAENIERATEVRTVVMPDYEVPVTETPGLNPEDRPAMQAMVSAGYLDMLQLAAMPADELIKALSTLTDDYQTWIGEQSDRIDRDLPEHSDQATAAMARCEQILARLREGVAALADEQTLEAFRLANQAMADQRVHSLYALAKRRGEEVKVSDFWQPKNHSWRPFQLAFMLLSIPAIKDPLHEDRTEPLQAYADLLWFPTGGGKTEAYLGVAAFTMFIRRLQGDLGGYDSSRGLSVIMRYTLRLLTLQQFQRATALICSMEVMRRNEADAGNMRLGATPFTIGLWVGNKVTPGSTDDSHKAISDIRNEDKWDAGGTSPAQLTSCPRCGSEIDPKRHIEVDRNHLRTKIYCGDSKARCEFSEGASANQAHPGLPAVVVDEEIYHRPPSMMIATVDKFAMMAWRGETRTLFGIADTECSRHGLVWPDADCTGRHPADRKKNLDKVEPKRIAPIRPPDLIIQDEFHLISGPLGTMVGLYETAVDELCTWSYEGQRVRPKVVASTATVRKAKEQVEGVFMRQVAVFPPHGLDIEDNFFSVQRPVTGKPGRRYVGVCSPGASRPAMLIRVYTALLTAGQALFDRFGQVADPYLTTVGYFNSLRELGGMKRLAEDDVQTRSYRVSMSLVERPGLAQRSVSNIRELTSRVSSQDIPKYLDQLEVKFKAEFDPVTGQYQTNWDDGELRAIDVVLATNMLSVGVDVNRLGVMAVNGQPKGTAEYIQATSRVGRQYPGIVFTVLTWARPRDLSHYETFEHYHATFYKHVEAQSVTPFSPRALDRALTGSSLSLLRLTAEEFNPNAGAGELDDTQDMDLIRVTNVMRERAHRIRDLNSSKLVQIEMADRFDQWAKQASIGGRTLAYERRGAGRETMVPLLEKPGLREWQDFTVPQSMREVEPGVPLIMS
ncbi:MAG: DISARM system helicase DrmA, partial [Proteobacteria bacterium]|nr:DISARM system helicase DrmA [Pseudomonadota bacterium]